MSKKVQPYLCPICNIVHPEFQLDVRIRYAKDWYERYDEPTMVYLGQHGYDHALLDWGVQRGHQPIVSFSRPSLDDLVKRGMEIVHAVALRKRTNTY